MGAVPVVWVAAVGLAVSSGAVTVWNVLVMSLRQSVIPSRLLGRVHGTWRTLLWGTMPLGSVLGGLLGRVDLAAPMIVAGALTTVAGVVWFRFLATLPDPAEIDNGGRTPARALSSIAGGRLLSGAAQDPHNACTSTPRRHAAWTRSR